MKKRFRLLKNKDFKRVLDKRSSVANNEYIIYFRENEIENTRIGISVSSKIGNSVVRHKIKRQVDQMLITFIDFKEKIDYVIILRKGFLENSFQDNQEKLKSLIKKTKDRMKKHEKKP